MSGAVPPLPNTPSRRGAHLSTGTTLLLLYSTSRCRTRIDVQTWR